MFEVIKLPSKKIMENFLCRYLYLKGLEYFKMNQPISY